MNQTAIIWPMIAHVVLVYAVYVLLGFRRVRAVRSGAVEAAQFRTRKQEPDGSITAHNNIPNQFELPVLFHVVCLALYVTAGVSIVTVVLAWLFIATRYVHAWVHVTINRLRYRSRLFRAGMVVVGVMWIWLALHIAGAV
jgi:hypothetical protein